MEISHFVRKITILFEDDSILVIDKPPGIVVDKSETQTEGTVEDWLESQPPRSHLARLERNGIVHRLDKDTSGLLLIAKTQKALENLQNQFKDRVVKKEYLALVHGSVEESGKVEASISRNPKNREKFEATPLQISTGGNTVPPQVWTPKEAVTDYEPIKLLVMSSEFGEKIFPDFNKIQLRKLGTMNYELFTLVACQPKTGRTHQIRVHLKYIGHPVVADEKYVGRKMYRLDRRWCPRQFLHATKIRFRHPVSGEWLEMESKLPEDLREVLDSLRSLEQ